jgi:hypothetical protein
VVALPNLNAETTNLLRQPFSLPSGSQKSDFSNCSTLSPPPKRHLCSLAALHEKNKNLGLTIESKQKMAFLLTFGSQPNVMGIHPASCVCFIDLNLMSLYHLLFIE